MLKRWNMLLLTGLLLFSCLMISTKAETEDAAEKVTVVQGTTVELSKGKSKKINIKNTEELKNSKSVRFSSSKKNVVKLSQVQKKSVVLNGMKPGTSTISIKTKNMLYQFKVKVTDPSAITISDTNVTMKTGNTKKIYIKNYDTIIKTYKDKSVYFEIADSTVAKFDKVKDGYAIIKAKQPGTTKLTITTNKRTFTCKITVK